MKKKILFVCSANTCRSAVMAAILTEYGHKRYDVSSAGIFARSGEPMMQECADALETLFGHGFSAYSHTSTRLHANHLRDNDMIVAVSQGYAEILKTHFPYYADKVTTFPGVGFSDISLLKGRSMEMAVERIKDAIFEMFLNDEEN
jgi:protein-tyrosine-phosphatase